MSPPFHVWALGPQQLVKLWDRPMVLRIPQHQPSAPCSFPGHEEAALINPIHPVPLLSRGIRTAMFLGCKNSHRHGGSGAGPWPTPPCQLAAPAPLLAWQRGQQHPERGAMPGSPRPPRHAPVSQTRTLGTLRAPSPPPRSQGEASPLQRVAPAPARAKHGGDRAGGRDVPAAHGMAAGSTALKRGQAGAEPRA